MKEFYRAVMHQFRNLLISLIAPEDHLLDLTESDRAEIREQAETAGSEKLQVLLSFLIAREEMLRFTSHPRLLIETTVIKMCHLGDFLSYEELLQKIGLLEKKLTQAASGEGVRVPATTSKSDFNTEEKTSETSTPISSDGVDDHQGWEDFLLFLSSKDKTLYRVLKGWRPLRQDANTLELGAENQSFSSRYFEDPEKQRRLKKLCGTFFNKEIRIEFKNHHRAQLVAPRREQAARVRSRPVRYSDLPQPVQDVLQIFEGEIKEDARLAKKAPKTHTRGPGTPGTKEVTK
jgi:DNA polymerase-3 subunit gamma/tau